MPERGESFLEQFKKERREISEQGHAAIRKQQREALDAHKKQILERQQQMGGLITKLYETVYEHANANHAELIDALVKEHHEKFGPLDSADSENL
ncbi:MAG: hypothetical protein A2751_03310 [Candidatus Doudnabacteria bacterium RIFCSPHIGHO2_01_FULL_46_14]|uniref:Uncharacterized protein n=1 Tax=Candidatus Doudnabacteria bacterium RIFCSPHIGHO2_01_FULL_46_14 TaxID=1817824 RepID=A0A1F5NKX8_9BACT|nr:MAG: hypothetical protein A2751_03310 [Candidatus Doudnabacteria bacterium RIFCSPHIGHO2_01_FULL_46_14]